MTDNQIKGIGSLVQEKEGKVSTSRVLLLLWGVGLFLVWAVVSIINQNIAEIPESVVTVIGILSGSKVLQRFGENTDKI